MVPTVNRMVNNAGLMAVGIKGIYIEQYQGEKLSLEMVTKSGCVRANIFYWWGGRVQCLWFMLGLCHVKQNRLKKAWKNVFIAC